MCAASVNTLSTLSHIIQSVHAPTCRAHANDMHHCGPGPNWACANGVCCPTYAARTDTQRGCRRGDERHESDFSNLQRHDSYTHLLHLCADSRLTTKCKSRETPTVSRERDREREREQVTETDRMTGVASRKCYIPTHTHTQTLSLKRCDWQLPQGL